MEFFKKYVSNTLAGSGNQHFFINEAPELVQTGRIYYKLFSGGEYNYSLLFSNIIDSTFADGSKSHKNIVCDSWKIERAALCIVPDCDPNSEHNFTPITFDGKEYKNVNPGEFFCSDPVSLKGNKGDYLCFEVSFTGEMIPYHEETHIPTFVLDGNNCWGKAKCMPFPAMIGCDRKVKLRVAYIGDSITQGLGTPFNSYLHWCANVSEMLGEDYAYWNLGLGYGRGADAATNGAWLFKAKQSDVAVVCFGVNDLGSFTADEIKASILNIVRRLKAAGVTVAVQTIPPYNYDERYRGNWACVNEWIKTELINSCDMVFDVVKVLGESEENSHMAKYGGHPNAEGCKAWSDALYAPLKELIEKTV